jgi:hypothetical protein
MQLNQAQLIMNLSKAMEANKYIEYKRKDHINKSLFFQSKLENAKYAITSGRKIGAKIYALPEDIVEVNIVY